MSYSTFSSSRVRWGQCPRERSPLLRLRHLSITCHKAIDSKGLLSGISFPRGGVHIDVIFAGSDQPIHLGFLPSPLTPIHDLLAPITTIKSQLTPQEVQVFGNDSVFTFRSPKALKSGVHPEFGLFPSTAVREFHASIRPAVYHNDATPWILEQLPALETLVFSNTKFPPGLLPALTKEPILYPALRIIAFFDCDLNSDIMKRL